MAVTDEAIEKIKAMITSGALRAGDRLPRGPDPAAEELVASDLEFHRRVVACSGNSVPSSLLESMSGPAARARARRGLTQAGARSPRPARGRGPWPSTGPSSTRSPRTTRR